MKLLFNLCIIFFVLISSLSGVTRGPDRAPLELKEVSNLLKWADLVVVGVKGEEGIGITLESVVLNKRPDLDLSGGVELGLYVNYEHKSPYVVKGYRYLFFLTILNSQESDAEPKDRVVCKATAGGNGVIPLFNLNELEKHPRLLNLQKLIPNYDVIRSLKEPLINNFGTDDGIEIKTAVEDLVAIYNEEDPKAQILLLIEGLNKGNAAMTRFCKELLANIELEPID